MREFDRGYSEVTFSKVAVLLDASEAIIHKEYHLCSGDPLVVGGETKYTRYAIPTMMLLTSLQMSVWRRFIRRLPNRLKSNRSRSGSKTPSTRIIPETLITTDFIAPKSKVEIVTGSNAVACLEVHDARMVGEVGFDMRIMEIFRKYGVSYISKVTNANTIDLIILEKDCTNKLVDELSKTFELISVRPVAIVCAIGSNIGQPGIMARASSALAKEKINIFAVSQTTRQTNIAVYCRAY